MFERSIARVLRSRLLEPRRFMQVLQGPRQVGKTTAVRQVFESLPYPTVYESADSPTAEGWEWVHEVWSRARALHAETRGPVALALDEVQKLPRWTEVVKQLWDEDAWHDRDVRVVLLGSSPVLIGRGLRESMAGRFETTRATHWTWPECRDAFGWDLDTYVFYGGYPGAAPFVGDDDRWRSYVLETAVEPTISRDVLHMTRVDKPAVLRRLVYLTAEYSGRELSYRKILGQLDDTGNATTVAHYLDLLEGAGIASGLQKWAGEAFRRRASTPKLLVHNTAVMSAMSRLTFEEARANPEWWGRVVETCVGAHLYALSQQAHLDALHYWRDRSAEVDFVFRSGRSLLAIEVKSGTRPAERRGLEVFRERFGESVVPLVVGADGMELGAFLEADLVAL